MRIAPQPAEGTRLAARASAVAPFHVMRLLARARELEAQGRHMLHLEIGEPDFSTPAPIMAAGRRALAEARCSYTPTGGLPQLRRAISAHYRRRYGIDVAAERILVTPGASGALQLALFALLDPGNGIMIADPSYPCYRQIAHLAGAALVTLPVGSESGYKLTGHLAQRAWVPGLRVVLVASPANPTGAVLSREELSDLYTLCRSRGATLIVDEIYQGLVYGVEDHTALALPGDGLMVVNSCSKFFGMTGWRVGWIVAPEDAVDTLQRLAQNLFIAAATPSQYAACAAFEPELMPVLEARRQIFAARRSLLLDGIRALGFGVGGEPSGAFYLYARLPDGVACDAMTFATDLLEGVGVAVTPGADFGEYQADRHLRFAYTRPRGELVGALARLADYLG